MGTYFSPMLNMHFSSKEQAEAFEKKAILDEQIRQNELIKEQNRLLKNEPTYTSPRTYHYDFDNDEDFQNDTSLNKSNSSILPLLSFASIIPIIIGLAIMITRVSGADATLIGIRFILGGLIFPSMYWVKSKRSIISIFAMTFIIIGFIFTLIIK